MPSTFLGLSIGTTGLYTYQASINTAGHNISNASTPGYTRQIVTQRANRAISVSKSYGMCGTGVNATGIIQYRSNYLDVKYSNNSCLLGNYSTKEYYMTAVENYFSEVKSDGSTASFDDFYSALNTLVNDGGNLTMRTQVVSYAGNLTKYIQSLANSMSSLQKESNFEIKNTSDRINSIAESIASLNKQINTIEMSGSHANDLRDSRANLIDELSKLANITTSEEQVGDTPGVTKYEVRLDGQLLVDTYEYNKLNYVKKNTINSQNDVEGLYELTWSNGQQFNSSSKTLGGALQALFQVRDGNNQENLRGNIVGTQGSKSVTLTNTNCNDINQLNLPASGGTIMVGDTEYEYNSFTVKVNDEGKYEYTFDLKRELSKDVTGQIGQIGKSIDYKGIPFYLAKLNEFVRTYSSSFNELHNQGEDLNGDKGVDFFTVKDGVTGSNYNFSKEKLEKGDVFSSLLPVDASGNIIQNEKGLVEGNYYQMTAFNFCVAESLRDPNTFAAAEDRDNGPEDVKILEQIAKLKSDSSMFKQGSPDAFLQAFTADIAIDSKRAATFVESQTHILAAVDTQRMSISGVDKDEETVNLLKFKEAYDLSAKFIQILNEIYDKLINGMGV